MKSILPVKLLGFCFLASTCCFRATSQSTAFTYQGRFTDHGTNYTGAAEFQPTLWDDVTGGTKVADHSPVSLSVNVSDGLFTLPLDFGAMPFASGSNRWLQLEVRTVIGPFTALSPRQPLTPTPYAIAAGGLTGTLPFSQMTGTVQSGQLSGAYAGAVTFNNAGNSFSGSGAGLTALNAGNLASGTVPDARLAATVARTSQVWLLGGNAGTTPGSQFLGTTDYQPLELKVNGQRGLRIEPGDQSRNLIGGAEANSVAVGVRGATIAGGGQEFYPNRVEGDYGSIGGGYQNTASGYAATVGGGVFNTASGELATVGGGYTNTASNYYATVGGGYYNTASGNDATVGGGALNTASSYAATVGGGYTNTASNDSATVGGGHYNTASGVEATVEGGAFNTASGDIATVGGGRENTASGERATVGGGNQNTASIYAATVGGGYHNTASNYYATVGGGHYNTASGVEATVGGGHRNTASGEQATVGGGYTNTASSFAATVGGGALNTASGDRATVGGGYQNTASIYAATVGGGYQNTASQDSATVGGGYQNTASGERATVGGGYQNTASGANATVGGGYQNTASNYDATVGGGHQNTASGDSATVGGGLGNLASGYCSTVPGGSSNTASGNFSFAGGQNARAVNKGAFVWADSQSSTFTSFSDDQFLIRAAGGVGINTNKPGGALGVNGNIRIFANNTLEVGAGVAGKEINAGRIGYAVFTPDTLDVVGGGTTVLNRSIKFWCEGGATFTGVINSPSDRSLKTDFKPLDTREILAKVAALPIQQWVYRVDDTKRHIGPVAQDFHAAFGLNGDDDKHIATVDADGVALAAIQGLNQKLEAQEAENAELNRKNELLEKRLEALEQIILHLKSN